MATTKRGVKPVRKTKRQLLEEEIDELEQEIEDLRTRIEECEKELDQLPERDLVEVFAEDVLGMEHVGYPLHAIEDYEDVDGADLCSAWFDRCARCAKALRLIERSERGEEEGERAKPPTLFGDA